MTRRLWSLLVLVFLLVLDVSPMIINSNSSNSIRNNNSNNRTSTTSLSPSSFFKRQKKDWDDFSKLPVELFQNILRFMKKAEDKKELRRTSRRYGGQGSIINNFVFESMAVKITSDDPLSLSDMDVLAGMSKNFRHVSIDHASEFFDIMNEHSNSSPNYYNFSQPALAVLEMPHLNSLRLNFDIALESFDIDQQEREIDDINSDLVSSPACILYLPHLLYSLSSSFKTRRSQSRSPS